MNLMKTNQVFLNIESNETVDSKLHDLGLFCINPEPEYNMASGGSSQVLDDFLEFTDYCIPFSLSARHSKTEDYYSAFSSL